MKAQDFSATFSVDQTPEQVFAAVNNVRGWWSENIHGHTDRLGAVFDYAYRDVHRCKIKIVEFVPNQRVVWYVLENHFSFTEDKSEWTDTKVVFEIAEKGGQTELRFTHVGLVPEYECYDICSDGWTTYINRSLRSLILTGDGYPNAGEAITDSERALSQTS